MNVVLIGLRGTGKSTVGRILSERLRWPFFDSDAAVQERAGMTIHELFTQKGEGEFRRLESEVIKEYAAKDFCIIATGGGAILDESNVAALRKTGFVVHLSANPTELWRRISLDAVSAHTRPALLKDAASGIDELEKILLARAFNYAQARHSEVLVDTRTPVEVAEAILILMKAHGIAKRPSSKTKRS